MSEQRQGMASVIAIAAPYWAGEAEIVRTYFSRPRTRVQDLYWLKAQAYKEARPFRDLPETLRAEFLRTGLIQHLPNDNDTVQRIVEETRHFWLLAELIASCFGEIVLLTDVVTLREDRQLQELRAAMRAQGGPLEKAAVDFTEGGGGAMFHVLSQLEGGEVERKIASVFQIIAREEIPHGPMEIYAIAHHAKSELEWERVRVIVRDISRQRLLMRNEMFGFPLKAVRMQEIDAGQIQPWSIPLSL